MSDTTPEVTELLRAWSAGDLDARDRAMALVYRELRRRAATHLRRERPGHTLQPTALVGGDTVGDVLANVIKGEPDWTTTTDRLVTARY